MLAEADGVLAGAFGTTFWVATGLIAPAVVPVLLLPRPRRADDTGANADSGAGAGIGGKQAEAARALDGRYRRFAWCTGAS